MRKKNGRLGNSFAFHTPSAAESSSLLMTGILFFFWGVFFPLLDHWEPPFRERERSRLEVDGRSLRDVTDVVLMLYVYERGTVASSSRALLSSKLVNIGS